MEFVSTYHSLVLFVSSSLPIPVVQAPVVQKLDSAIIRINHYPTQVTDECENQLHYPVDSDLSGGSGYPPFEQLGPEHLLSLNAWNRTEQFIALRKSRNSIKSALLSLSQRCLAKLL